MSASVTIGAGNVTIKLLNGEVYEEVTLRPTLKACRALSQQSGGIMSAVQAVGRFDFEVITAAVALGLDARTPDETNRIAERVYATGLADLIEPVTRFLTIIANGGRPVNAGGSGEPDPR